MKIWLVTEEYNEYDQFGEYFVAAFNNKPTATQLMRVLRCNKTVANRMVEIGGGRTEQMENQWYYLKEYKLK